MVEDRSLQLVVQLLGLLNPAVHGRVHEYEEAEEDDEADSKVGIQETNNSNLKIIVREIEWLCANNIFISTWTKMSIEYWPTASRK